MKSSREASGPRGSGGGSGDRGVYSAFPAAGALAGRVNIRTACRPGGGLSQGGPAARASWCQLGARGAVGDGQGGRLQPPLPSAWYVGPRHPPRTFQQAVWSVGLL